MRALTLEITSTMKDHSDAELKEMIESALQRSADLGKVRIEDMILNSKIDDYAMDYERETAANHETLYESITI